jgi:hypothetical protein
MPRACRQIEYLTVAGPVDTVERLDHPKLDIDGR